MIQGLPYQDLVDLSLFEAPVSDESRFAASSISDIKPGPRIEITSWDGEPSAYRKDEPALSASCAAGPMEFEYSYASYHEAQMRQKPNCGPREGFMSKFRRNNRRNRTTDDSRNQTIKHTNSLPTPSQPFPRSASDPCLNASMSSGSLSWCPERESWLYVRPSPNDQRPSTSNGTDRGRSRGGPNSFLTEYYNDGLTVVDPPPPYEHHKSDIIAASTPRNESQWGRIAQRVCRSTTQ